MNKIIFLLLGLLFIQLTNASEKISSFLVDASDKNFEKIANQFEVVRKHGSQFEVYVLENKLNYFKLLSPSSKLIDENIHAHFQQNLANGYKNYAEVEKTLNSFVVKYSDFLTLENYGQSKNGKTLYALKFNVKNSVENKEEVMITGATHGDELMPVEVLLKIMDELFSNYGKDSRITKMLETKVIYFIPVVSPDSFESRSRYVEGSDPNRSYPWPENLKNKPVGVIDSLIKFFHSHNILASMDLHAYGRLVMYPWGYTTMAPSSAPDVSKMADIVSTMAKENEYQHGQISTTIYVAKGNSADYYYWKNKTKAIAVEIGDDKIPNISKLPSYVNESREMFYKFLEFNYL